MKRVYLDVETCGFHGVPVIAQYAIEDGPIQIHEFWRTPMCVTMDFIREVLCPNIVVGFNLAFDWFHICKIYTLFEAYGAPDLIPLEYIEDIAKYEKQARDGSCVKPAGALDLMLYAKKTDLQITMDRGDVRVRRVPSVLAWELAKLLDSKIVLDPILFAGRKSKYAPRFVVHDIKMSDGTMHPSLKDIVLKFRPKAALKTIAEYKLGASTTLYTEIEIDRQWLPEEYGYAPFAEAKGIKPKKKRQFKAGKTQPWPKVLERHIDHWAYNQLARQYAQDDIKYTRSLDALWNHPQHSDDDSILACSTAACRWKGYRVDIEELKKLIQKYKEKQKFPTAPNRVKEYLREVMNPIEWASSGLEESTKKSVLKELAENWTDHEAGVRAKNVLEARLANKKMEVFEKLLCAGRFHAAFKVIGALSGRMSGDYGLNSQGIDKTKEVRGCFPLAFDGEVLLGGDMQSFEISIADADYNDPKLREALLTCEKCNILVNIDDRGRKKCAKCGGSETKSFHALFAMGFWPHMTYEEIMATKGTSNPIYNYAKNAAFATLYGAQPAKIAATLGLDEDAAQEGYLRFWRTYEVAGRKRKAVEFEHTSLFSLDGGAIHHKKAADFIESLLGFPRYFTLENYLIKALFDIANDPPKQWMKLKTKIIRSKRGEQYVGNALRSALYGAAFATQNAIIRQAANHRIQSTGAGITKTVQVSIWNLQPHGVNPWYVRPMNIHDEIQCPTHPDYVKKVEKVVYDTVEKFRPTIPLIGIDFGRLNSWADK